MDNIKPRVKVPKSASAGEVITIKTLINHPMEFTCEFNGKPVFSCELEPAISANPYIEFSAKVNEEGTFKFSWLDDDGSVYETENKITIK
jgi:sulfur-oxidizing protein SoxZ